MADEQEAARRPVPSAEETSKVAITVLIASCGGIVLFAAVVILVDSNSAKDIFNALLPVLGTWVGTVLAYYFTKENFYVANRSMAEMARQTASGAGPAGPRYVGDKMLPRKSMVVHICNFDKTDSPAEIPKKIQIGEILKLCDDTNMNRIPVLDKQDRLIYVINRKYIDQYTGGPAPINTLHDLFGISPKLKDTFETVPTAQQTTTLAEAKRMMESVTDCRDVIVTADGSRASAVVGWLTDSIIRESARI